ncbi:unnamed protein product [Paramecium sonneborni]|uniref:Uncharacterized protein n=1 Tax=Paramecium sonneborni TaxID=65129 RepID=A0A8S1RUK9_9CILI|nr:unnamed protein product [Paramecium sonneborni]
MRDYHTHKNQQNTNTINKLLDKILIGDSMRDQFFLEYCEKCGSGCYTSAYLIEVKCILNMMIKLHQRINFTKTNLRVNKGIGAKSSKLSTIKQDENQINY